MLSYYYCEKWQNLQFEYMAWRYLTTILLMQANTSVSYNDNAIRRYWH